MCVKVQRSKLSRLCCSVTKHSTSNGITDRVQNRIPHRNSSPSSLQGPKIQWVCLRLILCCQNFSVVSAKGTFPSKIWAGYFLVVLSVVFKRRLESICHPVTNSACWEVFYMSGHILSSQFLCMLLNMVTVGIVPNLRVLREKSCISRFTDHKIYKYVAFFSGWFFCLLTLVHSCLRTDIYPRWKCTNCSSCLCITHEVVTIKLVPYRLVYKTHFFAPNSDIKRRGASYTWVCLDFWDTKGEITI